MSTLSWVHEFEKKYGNDALLQDIKPAKIHGSIQINFCNGTPVNYNLTIHRRATIVTTSFTSSNSTSNTGGEDGDST
jgi:hypothetical protein